MPHDSIDLINGMTQDEFNNLSREEKKVILADSIRSALDEIQHIHCHIHRIVLTGPYTYLNLEIAFGQLSTGHSQHEGSHYQRASYGHIGEDTWTILTNPQYGYMPQCKIWAVGIMPEAIFNLAVDLPQLNIQTAEYAMDFVCGTPEGVRKLFHLFKRYSRINHLRRNRFNLFDHSENFTLHLGKFKIYERGNDSDAISVLHSNGSTRLRRWAYDTLNTVRVEFTPSYQDLVNNNTRLIERFNESPLFWNMLCTPSGQRRWRFMKFKDGAAVEYPKEWQQYEEEQPNLQGYPYSIQNELFFMRLLDARASSRLIDVREFDPLRISIKRATANFYIDWHNRYEDFHSQLDTDY